MTTAISGTTASTATTSSTAAATSTLPYGADSGTSLPTTGLITDSSVGSGIDVDSLVTQLVAAAAAPGNAQIEAEQTQYQTQLAAVSGLQAAITTFQSAVQGLATTSAFTAFTATPSDLSVLTASAASTAAPGNYSVTVQKLATQEQLSSAAFSGGGSSYVGTGTLTLTAAGQSMTLNIDSSDDTLDGVVSAINSATGNPGITASDVSTSGGSVLFLTSTGTGAKNAITVTASGGDGGLAQLSYPAVAGATTGSTQGLTQLQAAQDADVTIAGLDVTSATNTIDNALPGVTLNLLSLSPTTTTGTTTTATPLTLTIADDTTTTTTQVNAFVSAYNSLQSEMANLGAYNTSNSTAGPLLGDPLLSNLQNQITSDLFKTVTGITGGGGLNSLASIGITPNSSGQLQVDSTTLQNALSTNYNAVGQIFGATGGVAATLNTTLTSVLSSTGSLQSRTNVLNTEMTQSQTAQTQLDQQMAVLQSTYLAQFTALDTLLAGFQSTASFLTTQLAGFSTAATEDSLS